MAKWNQRTKDDIELIKLGQYTAFELAHLLHRNRSVIYMWARELGITLPKPKGHRTYTINESFFNLINPNSAYVLGFVAADGYISNDGLEIALASKDESHVQKIKNLLSSNHPISRRTINGHLSSRVMFCSKYLSESLTSLGI